MKPFLPVVAFLLSLQTTVFSQSPMNSPDNSIGSSDGRVREVN